MKLPSQYLHDSFDVKKHVKDERALRELGRQLDDMHGSGAEGAVSVTGLLAAVSSIRLLISTIQGQISAIDSILNGRGVFARVRRSTTQTLTTATVTPISFDTVTTDALGFWSSGDPTKLTIPSGLGGPYIMGGSVRWDNNGTGTRSLTVRMGGSTELGASASPGHATDALPMSVPAGYDFDAADYIELIGYQTSGGNLGISPASQRSLEFWIARVF